MSSSTASGMFTYVTVRINCPVKNGKKKLKVKSLSDYFLHT